MTASPTEPGAPDPTAAQRFLVVALRRIQVIDRHPEDGEPVDAKPTADGRFVPPSFDSRPEAHRPEVHTYDVTLAVPERDPVTFDLALDEPSQYRLLVLARGWTIEPDGAIRLSALETTNWSIVHSNGAGEGPNPRNWSLIPLAPDKWQYAEIMRARDRAFWYYEYREVRFGPITAQPLADARRGTPTTTVEQERLRIEMPQLRKVTLP